MDITENKKSTLSENKKFLLPEDPKKIIVTEKPSVAQTFAKVLGVHGPKTDGYIENDEWIITWCVGHLVTLSYPEEYDESLKQWSFDTLPFLPDRYKYHVIPDVRKQFNVIKKLYNRTDVREILYAGDPGREGIYIQMLVRQEAGVAKGIEEKVVWIDSQTEDEIKRGIREAKPLGAYMNLSESGYMRAIEDFAIGINFSRALTLKYRGVYPRKQPVAVGRVMTCVLGMIVDREREIINFTPTKFYKVQSTINVDGTDIVCTWKVNKEADVYKKIESWLYSDDGFKTKAYAENFISGLGHQVKIKDLSIKEDKKYAPLLFNLAELQATCSKTFKISPDKTLEIAQSLYEKKLTTYPRTDARVLSTAIAVEVDRNLNGLKGYDCEIDGFIDDFMGKGAHKNIKNTKYTDDSKVTDHYAIIPTGQSMSEVKKLSDLEAKVYDIIVRRFVSVFMDPAVYKKVSLNEADTKRDENFYATGSALVSPGYMACAGIPKEKDPLPKEMTELKKGDIYDTKYSIAEGETKPPTRYTSGSIILAMENAGKLIEDEELRAQIKGSGIGTSATRAEVIKKLVSIGYIALNAKTQVLTPAEFGNMVYEIAKEAVPEMLSPKMTAEWEQGLDLIAEGKILSDKYKRRLNDTIINGVEKIKNLTIGKAVTSAAGTVKSDGKSGAGSKTQKVTSKDVTTYLNVPFSDKDVVKALGARWDMARKCWYVPVGKDIRNFSKWISGGTTKSVKKVYLNVPFDDKDKAKSLGARWDNTKKQWYIMSNQNQMAFKKWIA